MCARTLNRGLDTRQWEARAVTETVPRLAFKATGPHLVEVLDGGRQVAEAPVSELVPGTAAWDRKLEDLGFRRTADWTPTEGGHRCTVDSL